MDSFLNGFSAILVSTISMSVPLIFAALGGVFSVRSGIMALGLESMMMTGAYCAVLGSYLSNNVFVGLVCGMLGGALIGILHGILCVRYRVNQVISGIGLNLLALATTTLLMQLLWKNRGSSPQVASIEGSVEFLSGIPILGSVLGKLSFMSYLAILLVIVSWFVIFRTKFGLRMRMVGENPVAANSMGLKVHAMKYYGVLICGLLAGLGGAFLSIDHLNMFVRDMTAGRGYIAVAVSILSRYNPIGVLIFALLFGFSDAIQIILQGQGVPSQFVQMLPYIVTLFVLVFGVRHIQPPAGVAKHEDE